MPLLQSSDFRMVRCSTAQEQWHPVGRTVGRDAGWSFKLRDTMALRIEKDHQRFRHIVKGKIREDLRKFLTRGELLGKEGKYLISIPVRGIEIPHFRYGDNDDGGVGQGDGKAGDEVDGDDGG